ncbi:hypothetical protein PA598K_02277 [Paenibacillus sp. 598K]|uniref:spore germination protein n=1 Tax=Paenibacillus sp. 598K TaxID=1117987 RepID=UPI000FFA05D9|nr:spore germination protein [Paenibacillus sp. 598K]GBF73951.1 hypothetical protein PA598K_02277 [Paenibacillus sp. 598K]
MADLLTLIYRLNEAPGARSLYEQLNEAFSDSADYITERLGTDTEGELILCYLRSLCSSVKLNYLLRSNNEGEISIHLDHYRGNDLDEGDFNRCKQAICQGFAVLCKRGSTEGIILNLEQYHGRTVQSPITENVLQGPMSAFTENLDINTALIRQQLRSSKLKLWEYRIGEESHTRIAIYSYSDKTDETMLTQLKEKIKGIRTESLQDSGQLLRLLLSSKRMKLFPLAVSTERPDRASTELMAGKAVIIVDGSPFALSVPSVYTDFWHSPEDKYVNGYVAYFLLTLRFLAMLANLFLPALYVALTSVNVDVNRLEISLAASASREGVPYPVFVETLLMLIIIDFITEAGLRLPKTISSTVTMVGGVVLGQAIIQANIVSHLLVIITAATAITNFIVVDYQMGLVQRILKYFIMIGATIAGLLGVVFCFACLIFYLSCLESFGSPYLTSLRPKKGAS